MSILSSTPAAACARQSLRAPAEQSRLRAALETLILALLAALPGRHRHHAQSWHPLSHAPLPADALFASCAALTPEDEVDCRALEALARFIHRIDYLFGRRRNYGMAPHPRACPDARPRSARAPPASPRCPSVAKTPSGRGRRLTPMFQAPSPAA